MIPKKPVPDLIRDANRFSDKIMRNAKTAGRQSARCGPALASGTAALPARRANGQTTAAKTSKMAVLINNQLLKLCVFRIAAAQHYCFSSGQTSLFCG